MSKFKLDIFGTLAAIDQRDRDYFDGLSDEQRKGFAPPVVLRWTSASKRSPEWYLAAANNANMHFHDIYEYPELQYKLLASTGTGKAHKFDHEWIKMATATKSSKLYSFISTYYPDANRMEIELILGKHDENSFSDFIDGTGINTDDAKAIKKLFKDRRR